MAKRTSIRMRHAAIAILCAVVALGLRAALAADEAPSAPTPGAFKVPTLRNVATRRVFFHNGRFANLRDALRFYVRRDIEAASFYPIDAAGALQKFDDLPANLAGNVNTAEVPYDRKSGESPRLSESELDDLEAFLNTLTDGYRPTVRTPK